MPSCEDGYEFGELVYCRVRPAEMDRSLNPRWESGIWLGRRWGTASHIVAVSSAEVREVWAVARRPLSERWIARSSRTSGRPPGRGGPGLR
eukprot:9510013-Alexandrium_andersonii.AAC.1